MENECGFALPVSGEGHLVLGLSAKIAVLASDAVRVPELVVAAVVVVFFAGEREED
jgi:hypothetical protein